MLRRWRAAVARSVGGLRSTHVIAPAAAILGAIVVQGMILSSDFLDEDLRHFYSIEESGVARAALRLYSHHFVATFMVAIAGMHELFGLNPPWHFAVILLTHLLNVGFLYGIVRALSSSRRVAAVAAGLWGSSPIFHSDLRWFSAYSHMLGVTAMLWALWELARAAETARPPSAGALIRINVALLVGSATELTGSLAAAVFPAIAWLLLPREAARGPSALWLMPSALFSFGVVVVVMLTSPETAELQVSFSSVARALVLLSSTVAVALRRHRW